MTVKFKNFSITIDKEDYNKINACNWYLHIRSGSIHNDNNIVIGKIILNYHGPLEVIHKDRNMLNCRKDNLILGTRGQRVAYHGPLGRNKYKGVYWDKIHKHWVVYLKLENRMKFFGTFKDEIEAAIEYNKIAKKYWGEFAYLNDV